MSTDRITKAKGRLKRNRNLTHHVSQLPSGDKSAMDVSALDEEMDALKALRAEGKVVSNVTNMSGKDKLTYLQIVSEIHDSRDMKLQLQFKKMRERIAAGKSVREKTYAEENLAEVEQRVIEEFGRSRDEVCAAEATELTNKAALFDDAQANKEKLKGKFSLRLNKNLTLAQQIERYAAEDIVFHLHKNRNFVEKITGQLKEEEKNKKEAAVWQKMLSQLQKDQAERPGRQHYKHAFLTEALTEEVDEQSTKPPESSIKQIENGIASPTSPEMRESGMMSQRSGSEAQSRLDQSIEVAKQGQLRSPRQHKQAERKSPQNMSPR